MTARRLVIFVVAVALAETLSCPGLAGADPGCAEGAAKLAHLLGQLSQPAVQPAHADHSGERERSGVEVVFRLPGLDYLQATPLVMDGVMYTSRATTCQ